MASAQQRQTKTLPPKEADELAAADAERAGDERAGSEVMDDLDDLLAEIDAVLEEQSVLVNFRQRGGQ
ncbi:MAG: ubiquitin-like protein Pup [Acidimicrobiia bacterium]